MQAQRRMRGAGGIVATKIDTTLWQFVKGQNASKFFLASFNNRFDVMHLEIFRCQSKIFACLDFM
jgi:hypothetical protein